MKSTTTDQTGLSLTMQAIAELEAGQGRRCETVQQLIQELLEDDVPDQLHLTQNYLPTVAKRRE